MRIWSGVFSGVVILIAWYARTRMSPGIAGAIAVGFGKYASKL
jgi:hypothetical protein